MNDRIPSNMTMGKSSRPGIFYSLRSKMLFYFMFLFFTILLVMKIVEIYGIPFTRIQGEYKIRRSEVLMNLNLMADLKKERLLRWLEERRDDARVIARSPLIQTHIVKINQAMHDFESEGGDKQKISDYIQKENYQDLIEHFNLIINSYGVCHNIQVAELHGSNIIVSTDSNYLGSSIVISDAIRKKLADNEVSMNFIIDPQTKDLDLYIYHSILGIGDKTISGEKNAFILILHVHTEDLFTPMLYSGAGLGKTGEILLVNKEVKIITYLKHALPDGQIAKPLEYRIKAKPALLASRGEEGLIITEDYRGKPVLAAFRYIPITSEDGWGLVVKQDVAEVFRPLRQSIIYTSVIGLLGIIFVLITVYIVAENLSRPIRKLSAAAKTIEAGDLSQRVLVSGTGEIGTLIRAFNSMLQNIEAAQRELQENALELEMQSEELQESNEELQLQSEELQEQTEELEESNIELETQRKQVEDANRMKSEFLSNMSHELRTPLNSILALSRVVIDQAQESLSKEQIHYLEIVERNGMQLLQLINDILDLSRIEAGYIDLNPKSFRFAGIINVIVESLAPLAKEKGLKLKVDIPEDLPELESDETKVHQILMNIIGNAVKFTEKGTVTISVHCDVEQMKISTQDTGIGIAEDSQSSIFQEFHQLDASSSRSYEGTGLGLAIARKSARIMGGDITVESKLSKGSTFILTLPIKWPESLPISEILPAAIPVIQEPLSVVPSGQRILLVDDQEAVIIQVSTILENVGYTVDVARGGQEALDYLQSTIPDGIILDLMMPDVDGFDVLVQIRESKATAKIPVLVLTARDLTPDDLKKLKSNKIQQLIQKGDVGKKRLLFKIQLMLKNEPKTIGEKTEALAKDLQVLPKKKSKSVHRRNKPRTTPPTVLIVEDNPDNLTTIKAMLKDKYTLLEAMDGERGLKVTLENLPDLVIMDMMLPKMDGFELVNRIKADKKAKNIPVIALTAKAMKGDREKILAAGCDDYLAKPVNQKSILEKLEEWLA